LKSVGLMHGPQCSGQISVDVDAGGELLDIISKADGDAGNSGSAKSAETACHC